MAGLILTAFIALPMICGADSSGSSSSHFRNVRSKNREKEPAAASRVGHVSIPPDGQNRTVGTKFGAQFKPEKKGEGD